MRATNPNPRGAEPRMLSTTLTYSASRVLVGKCPECSRPLVVFNDGESWPLVACECGWRGATDAFASVRVERADRPVELRGFFPDGMVLRVQRPDDEIENQGTAAAVGLFDARGYAAARPWEQNTTSATAAVVVKP